MFDASPAGRRRQRGVRARRDPRARGPAACSSPPPHTLAHFRDWVVHEPALPLAGLRDVAEAGVRPRRPTAATDEWKRLLESWEDPGIDDGDRPGAPASTSARAQARARRSELRRGSTPRRPLRARADRAEDAPQPLLPGAALHRLRRREAVDAGGATGRSRPRAAGRRSAPSTARSTPRPTSTPYVSARLWDDGDVRALRLMTDEAHRARGARRRRALARRPHVEARESRLPPLAPSPDRERLRAAPVPQRDGARRHPPRAGRLGRRRAAGRARPASTSSTSTARTPTCRRSSSRRSTTVAPTPTAGSFENRARFWLETLELVREAVGDDCAIAVRIAADTLGRLGVELEEGLAFMRLADHLVDLWDVHRRRPLAAWRGSTPAPSRFFAEG